MTEPRIETHKVPLFDTGIGKGMGYADDRAFIEAAQAEREKLPSKVREVLDEVDRAVERKFLFGDG